MVIVIVRIIGAYSPPVNNPPSAFFLAISPLLLIVYQPSRPSSLIPLPDPPLLAQINFPPINLFLCVMDKDTAETTRGGQRRAISQSITQICQQPPIFFLRAPRQQNEIFPRGVFHSEQTKGAWKRALSNSPPILFVLDYMEQDGSVGVQRQAKPSGKAVPRRARRKIVNSESSSTERQLYYPDLNEYKKVELPIQGRRVVRGSWSLQENRTYLLFLSRYRRDFGSEEARRRSVVFNRLSKELHRRTPDQCRSHHQKLQNRFNNDIDRIIDFVQRKIRRRIAQAGEGEEFGEECQKGGKMALRRTGTSELSEPGEAEEGIVVNFHEMLLW